MQLVRALRCRRLQEFTADIEALRELPKARMPHVVHLPSTPPVAERVSRPTIGFGWLNPGLLRRFPATAFAGAVAIVLVIVALRVGSNGTLGPSSNRRGQPLCRQRGSGGPGPRHPHGRPRALSQCSSRAQRHPPTLRRRRRRMTPKQPALRVVLAAPMQVVTAGQRRSACMRSSRYPLRPLANPASAPQRPLPAPCFPAFPLPSGAAAASLCSPSHQPAAQESPLRCPTTIPGHREAAHISRLRQVPCTASRSRPAFPRVQRSTSQPDPGRFRGFGQPAADRGIDAHRRAEPPDARSAAPSLTRLRGNAPPPGVPG